MFDSQRTRSLYVNVITEDIVHHRATDSEVESCLGHLLGNAQADPLPWQKIDRRKALDFNRAACRLAYLHAYAPLHTQIAKRAMLAALARHRTGKQPRKSRRVLRLCSLGGGPGCDVIGLMSAFDEVGRMSAIEAVVTVVDECAAQWERTFVQLVREVRKPDYGRLGRRFSDDAFHWRYVEDDPVHIRDPRSRDAVSSSSLVVMNHLLSTLDSADAESVMDNVFVRMGPGSFALIIEDTEDNDALSRTILRQARHYQFIVVHWAKTGTYSSGELKSTLFGHPSCHRAATGTYLLKKSLYCGRPQGPRPLCERCADNVTSVTDLVLKKSVSRLRCGACEDDLLGSETSPGSGSSESDDSERGDSVRKSCFPWKGCKVPCLDGVLRRTGESEDESEETEALARLCRCRLM